MIKDLLWTFLMPKGAGKSCSAENIHSTILWENERISSIKLYRKENVKTLNLLEPNCSLLMFYLDISGSW